MDGDDEMMKKKKTAMYSCKYVRTEGVDNIQYFFVLINLLLSHLIIIIIFIIYRYTEPSRLPMMIMMSIVILS